MPQPQEFFGPWSVQVVKKYAAFSQRFRILGSDASDGYYPGVVGTAVAQVKGTRWTLELEWNDNLSANWQPSEVRRASSFVIPDGLLVTLSADDNVEPQQDHDFDDLVIVCRSLDPSVNPLPTPDPGYQFDWPERGYGKARKRPVDQVVPFGRKGARQ